MTLATSIAEGRPFGNKPADLEPAVDVARILTTIRRVNADPLKPITWLTKVSSREWKRVLSVEDWAEIRRLRRAEQMPIKQIARQMGISRNTVKRALASDEPPRYRRAPTGSMLMRWKARSGRCWPTSCTCRPR